MKLDRSGHNKKNRIIHTKQIFKRIFIVRMENGMEKRKYFDCVNNFQF